MSDPRRVLVVEDDPDIAELVALHVRDLGCDVIVEHNGAHGLKRGLSEAAIERKFRGAVFKVSYSRGPACISVDDAVLDGRLIREIEAGKTYRVEVVLEGAEV